MEKKKVVPQAKPVPEISAPKNKPTKEAGKVPEPEILCKTCVHLLETKQGMMTTAQGVEVGTDGNYCPIVNWYMVEESNMAVECGSHQLPGKVIPDQDMAKRLEVLERDIKAKFKSMWNSIENDRIHAVSCREDIDNLFTKANKPSGPVYNIKNATFKIK